MHNIFVWNINYYFEWVSHSVSFLKRFFLHGKIEKIFSPKDSAKISLYSGQASFYFNPGQCVIYSLIISLAPFIDPKGGFLRIFSSWKRTCGHVAKRRVSQKLLQIILSQLHVLPSRRIKCNKSKCNKIIKLKRTMSNWVKHAVNDVVYNIWNEDDL